MGIGQLDAACAAMVHLAQHAHNPSKATYGNRLGAVQLRGDIDLARLTAKAFWAFGQRQADFRMKDY